MSRSHILLAIILSLLLLATSITSTSYKSLSVIEWQKPDIYNFFESEFEDYAEIIRSELDEKDFSGNDLIMLDEDDLESQFGIENAEVRAQILDRIHFYAEKASNVEATSASHDVSAYWLPQDANRPEYSRRYNLKKLEEDHQTYFFAYLFMWTSSPAYTFLYFHYKNPELLRRMLHLPLDYEFDMQDYLQYIVLGRAIVAYRVYQLGYLDTNFYAALYMIVAQLGHFVAALYSLVTIKLVNPFSQILPTFVSTLGMVYFMPSFALNWKMVGATALMQSLSALPMAIMNHKLKTMMAATQAKKAAEAAKNAENATAVTEEKKETEPTGSSEKPASDAVTAEDIDDLD